MKIHGCQKARVRSGAAGPPLGWKARQRRPWKWGAGVWIAVACLSLLASAVVRAEMTPEERARFSELSKKVGQLIQVGKAFEALPLAVESLQIAEKAFGTTHLDTATSLDNLVEVYYVMGDFAKAEPLLQRALQIREKALGPTHQDTVTSHAHLAVLYHGMGDFAKAEPLLQRALQIREKALGPTHPNTATSLNNLAGLYKSMGDYAKAEPIFQRVLQIREQVLGTSHPHTASCLNNLAELYGTMGDYNKAEPLHLRALQIRENAIGSDHRDTADSLNNLGCLYCGMGDYAKAEPFLQRALQIREKVLGASHPDTAAILNNLAQLYNSTGDYSKAEPLHHRALQIQEKALGPMHPGTANSLNNLGAHYNAMGDHAKAEPLYQRALQIYEKVLGASHPDTAIVLNHLTYVKIDQGKLQDAFDLAVRARHGEEQQLENILAFASERQRLDFQKSTHPYILLGTLGRAPELAETVLHQKGVVLDSLLEDRLAATASNDPTLRDIIDQAHSARQRLSRLLMEVPKDLSEPARARREVEKQKLTAQAEQLESTLARQVTGLGRGRRALSVKVADVQAVLSKQEALIELLRYSHFLGERKLEPHYGAIVIAASGEPKWVPLGSAAEIEKSTALYQKSVRGQTDEATLSTVLKALHERIWGPIAQALPAGTTSVILSTDGDLSFVSFATLLAACRS